MNTSILMPPIQIKVPIADTSYKATQAYRTRYLPLSGKFLPGWQLVQLLSVAISQDEFGKFIAADDIFLVYGYGETPSQALSDYRTALLEYYQILHDDTDDEYSQELLKHLQAYLQPIR